MPLFAAAVAAAGPEEPQPPRAPASVPGAEQTAGQPESAPQGETEPGHLAHLRRLNHEDFKERKAAQAALLEWGKGNTEEGIETLYDVFRTTEDPEVRVRSREVLRRLVIINQPLEGPGYLGVRMEDAQVKDAEGEFQPAVRITEVREGTAAETAKLKPDDLVVGVDEAVFNELRPIIGFAEYIKNKSAGDEITLHIRRGEETLHLKARLQRRPPQLDRLTQWGTAPLVLPTQAELDESYFRDWLDARAAAERKAAKGGKGPAPAR